MVHEICGDWSIGEHEYSIIDCIEVYKWIEENNLEPEILDVNDIAYKPLKFINQNSKRYIDADINMPGIVVANMENPLDKPYRMIDGRRRLLKSLVYLKTDIPFYVIQYKDIVQFIQHN